MKTKLASAFFAVALATGAGALAAPGDKMPGGMDESKKSGRMMDESSQSSKTGGMDSSAMGATEATKHLALADVYLDSAKTNTKALTALSEMKLEKKDKKLIDESQKNLEMSLGKAMTHLGHVKMAAGELPAESATQIAEIERNLKEAKTSAKAIKSAKLDTLSTRVDTLSSQLIAADQAFGQLASQARFTQLDQMELGPAPVRGVDDRGMDQKSTSPGMDSTRTPPDTEQPSKPMEPTSPSEGMDKGKGGY